MSAVLDTSCGNCGATRAEVRRKTSGLIGLQCLHCGRVVRKDGRMWLKHADVADASALAAWDEDLVERHALEMREARLAESEAHNEAIERELTAKDEAWWEQYNGYLQSGEWRALRKRILERANYTCECCLQRRAVQVHHLRYRHQPGDFSVTNERAWELVAICIVCHDRVTAEDRQERANGSAGRW